MEIFRSWCEVSAAPPLPRGWWPRWLAQEDSNPCPKTWLLAHADKLSDDSRQFLSEPHPEISAAIESWRSDCNHVLVWSDVKYPDAFRQLAKPPLVVYAMGDLSCLRQRSIAIIGSRKASANGLSMAYECAATCAELGVSIVSGMARGIDGAAHRGALTKGKTIAVVGTGIDRVYPREHAALARQIITQGCILSPFPLGASPCRHHFPARNVLLSALSEAIVVVEAGQRSGSLSTARSALDQGKDVMAVPWSPWHKQGEGCLSLLKQGAALVADVQDVLFECGLQAAPAVAETPPLRQLPLPLLDRSSTEISPITEAALSPNAPATSWIASPPEDASDQKWSGKADGHSLQMQGKKRQAAAASSFASTKNPALDSDCALLLECIPFEPAGINEVYEQVNLALSCAQSAMTRLQQLGRINLGADGVTRIR